MFKKIRISSKQKPDYIFLGVVFFLITAGFFFLSSASSDLAKIKYNDSLFFIKNQLLKGFFPGLLGFLLTYFVYYRYLKKISPYLFIANLIFLILVLTPLGLKSHGSSRWINLGFFSFQPSEFLKITFILYLAGIFSSNQLRDFKKSWKVYWIFLFVSALVGFLIFIQPATTTAVIILSAGVIIYLFRGASWKQIGLTVFLGLIALTLLAFITPYRLYRIAPYWNILAEKIFPFLVLKERIEKIDKFHLEQTLSSISTGGLKGVGFGKSTSKYSILPEPIGDSIFAVIAEEFGFLGSLMVILPYMIIFWRVTELIKKTYDDFAKFILLGFISIISLQAIIHIGANSGILPFTGVPLPLISYGGSSFAVILTMTGIIANISRYSHS